MEKMFTDFFLAFPQEFSEGLVIKQIHKALECAEKDYKEDKSDPKYLKYMAKAYKMLETYFVEKGVHPDQVPY